MTIQQDFLSPANTSLDLDNFVFQRYLPKPEVPFTNFTLAYQGPVPFAPNERFPDDFSLLQNETSLSRTENRDKTYVSEINLYVLSRHLPLIHLIKDEISTPDIPHGAYHSTQKNCQGPICKRQKRLKAQESSLLNKHRKAYKANSQAKISPILTSPRARYLSLKSRNKAYAGPEPLLFLYTALELIRVPRSNLSKFEQHIYSLARRDLIYPYMLSIFSPDIT